MGALLAAVPALAAVERADEPPALRLRVEPGHPWRPPFGLERVGGPVTAVVEATARPAAREHTLVVLREGREIRRHALQFSGGPPFVARVACEADADELALLARSGPAGRLAELARKAVDRAVFEAEAVARPDRVVNPVDLGAILVPTGWLLLGPGQSAMLDVAALSRGRDVPQGRLRTWYASAPGQAVVATIALHKRQRMEQHLVLPDAPPAVDRDVLHVVIDDGGGRELWRKAITVMLVRHPGRRPNFGATCEKLRYDAPISVRDPRTGAYSSLRFEDGWKPELNDVVVWLPGGARYVFWRGSSYIPFWAGRYNTGACYEWAEIISRPPDAVDCVEPLMDKELRYSAVEIIESTPARVHIRWRYQSTDLLYKVWGDSVVEDYYFYPDGYGTRAVSLRADPKTEYELSEFIVLTPQGTYPFDVLPENLVDILFLDGRTHAFRSPNLDENTVERARPADAPAAYRLRLNRQETLSAIYFNPDESRLPPVVFAPFFDGGQMVTPCYWGSHWPLARGNATGSQIDDRVGLTPCSNSIMSWGSCRPIPLSTAGLVAIDTLGRARPMTVRRWAWLIGMTDEPDRRVLDRARSFATPPSLAVRGARIAFDAYAPDRRALCLVAEGREVAVTIKPGPPCVNPVFEIAGAPPGPVRATLADRPLDENRYAWDGHTFWLDATVSQPTELHLTFGGTDPGRVR
jgi:hypothetical protein